MEYQLVALNWLHAMHGLRLGCTPAHEMGLRRTLTLALALALTLALTLTPNQVHPR